MKWWLLLQALNTVHNSPYTHLHRVPSWMKILQPWKEENLILRFHFRESFILYFFSLLTSFMWVSFRDPFVCLALGRLNMSEERRDWRPYTIKPLTVMHIVAPLLYFNQVGAHWEEWAESTDSLLGRQIWEDMWSYNYIIWHFHECKVFTCRSVLFSTETYWNFPMTKAEKEKKPQMFPHKHTST